MLHPATLAAACFHEALQAVALVAQLRALSFGSAPRDTPAVILATPAGMPSVAAVLRLFPAEPLRLAALVGAVAGSGAVSVPLLAQRLSGRALPVLPLSALGATAGACHVVLRSLAGGNRASWPVVRRPRLVQAQQGLPRVALAAAATTAATLAAYPLLSLPLGSLRPSAGPALLLRAAPAVLVCAAGWSWAAFLANLVATQAVAFAPPRSGLSLEPVLACMAGGDGVDPQASAMAAHELCEACEAAPRAGSSHRAAVFADKSGQAWAQVARACVRELECFVDTAAAGLHRAAAPRVPAAPPAGPGGAVQWNVHRGGALSSASAKEAARLTEAARTLAFAQAWRMEWAVRSLGGLVRAARSEDKFGLLQLRDTDPRFGKAVGELTSFLLAVRGLRGQGRRRGGALPGWAADAWGAVGSWVGTGGVESSLRALEDTAALALYGVVWEYADDPRSLLEEAQGSMGVPRFGSKEDNLGLIRDALSNQL